MDAEKYISDLDMFGIRLGLERVTQLAGLAGHPEKQGSLMGFCAEEHLPDMLEGRGDYLPQAVAMSIDYLSRDKDGFVLMVEGSAIDFACHSSDVSGSVGKMMRPMLVLLAAKSVGEINNTSFYKSIIYLFFICFPV